MKKAAAQKQAEEARAKKLAAIAAKGNRKEGRT